METREYYLALSLAGVFSPVTQHRLIAAAGSAAALFKAPDSFFRSKRGLRKTSVEGFLYKRKTLALGKAIRELEKRRISWVTLADCEYPELLQEIHDPPLTLYLRGSRRCWGEYPLAVVGTRRCSHYGRRAAEEIVGKLSPRVSVISGMAAGIDGVAHRAALKKGLPTVAVLGTGVDIIYPTVNRPLYRELLEEGTIVSEFPPGTGPQKHHFPQRNRIISGLSRGVLVVESSQKSGSLITASFALAQNRDVFAVPGSIFRQSCAGTNALIREGAVPVTRGSDISDFWGLDGDEASARAPRRDPLTEDEKTVINHLDAEDPVSMEEIACALEGHLPMGRLSAALLSLKMKKYIMELDNRRFVLKDEDEL